MVQEVAVTCRGNEPRAALRSLLIPVLVWAVCVQWPLGEKKGFVFLAENVLVAVTFFATGVFLRADPRHRSAAIAVTWAGLLWPLNWINEWGWGPFPLIAAFQGPLSSSLLAWALLRYPNPWARARHQQIVTTGLVVLQVAAVAEVVTRPEPTDPGAEWFLTISQDSTVHDVVEHLVYEAGGAVVALAVVVGVTVRFWRSPRFDRKYTWPLVIAVLGASVAAGTGDLAKAVGLPERTVDGIYGVESVIVLGIPVAFLFTAVRQWYDLTAVPRLTDRLRGARTPSDMQDVLRAWLGDPTLTVYYRLDRSGTGPAPTSAYVDSGGQELSGAGSSLPVPLRVGGGREIAVVMVDPLLRPRDAVLEPVLRATALVVANLRLQVAISERIAEVRRSAERLAAAVDAEAGRVADSLALGTLRHLDDAACRAGALALATSSDVTPDLALIERDSRRAAAELQALWRDGAPDLLLEHGLAAALLAVDDPRVTIDLPADRLAPTCEAAAYFIVSECVANAIKHAEATTIAVSGRLSTELLTIEVTDDGRGGVDSSGEGIRGIIERARRVAGEIELSAAETGGTRATVRIPV